jgi:hypothetical protein
VDGIQNPLKHKKGGWLFEEFLAPWLFGSRSTTVDLRSILLNDVQM